MTDFLFIDLKQTNLGLKVYSKDINVYTYIKLCLLFIYLYTFLFFKIHIKHQFLLVYI